jgi:predicted transposase/invertase (TIGR01784 family)
MTLYLKDKYINLLTDFGFKRIFGTEPNKHLLIDFLNTLLPDDRQIEDVTFKNNENLGNTGVDRKAIFDIYCQGTNGERFIVELQKAKQNFFKDRSVFYATFPIQEQALKGAWNFKLAPVYAIGVLDFVFDDHKSSEQLIHRVDLKDQNCEVFYDKLQFIYIELPKFQKTIEELQTHGDKWLYLLKHLPDLDDLPPPPLQEEVFNDLFIAAKLANFSPMEQDSYQNSLKYYRDLNNVVDTSREEGREEGRKEGLEEGRKEGEKEGEKKGLLKGKQTLIIQLLSVKLGELPAETIAQVSELSSERLDDLGVALFGLGAIADLQDWLRER